MRGEIQSQIRSVQLFGILFLLALALAIIGLVWLSQWAVETLRPTIDFPAEAAIGLLCLLPILLFALRQHFKNQAEHREHEEHARHSESLAQISHIATGLVEKSPVTALAIAALAGMIAVRFPAALTLMLQALNPERT